MRSIELEAHRSLVVREDQMNPISIREKFGRSRSENSLGRRFQDVRDRLGVAQQKCYEWIPQRKVEIAIIDCRSKERE